MWRAAISRFAEFFANYVFRQLWQHLLILMYRLPKGSLYTGRGFQRAGRCLSGEVTAVGLCGDRKVRAWQRSDFLKDGQLVLFQGGCMKPEILYEDAALIVAVKPRGVLSEGDATAADTMPALLAPLAGEVYPVHRLDRGVGGVMVYAKNRGAAAVLCRAVAAGALDKTYLAVVSGRPDPAEGEWRDHLWKDSAANKSFVVSGARRGAREAVLRYRVLDTVREGGTELSRVSVTLLTGRSHQIRVQFASRGFPLVGDGKYGSRVRAPFPALYAQSLSFPHPESGRRMSFSSPVPAEFPYTLFGTSALEIEHKYLIDYPDPDLLEQLPGIRKKELVQTYLSAPAGETRRVRRVCENGAVTYRFTRKVRRSDLCALEEEKELTPQGYEALLTEADLTRHPVEKTRYCLPYQGRTVEIDIYPFWSDRAIAEVEVADAAEAVALPPFLHVFREVSGDKRYKNVNLAREVPNDPLPL